MTLALFTFLGSVGVVAIVAFVESLSRDMRVFAAAVALTGTTGELSYLLSQTGLDGTITTTLPSNGVLKKKIVYDLILSGCLNFLKLQYITNTALTILLYLSKCSGCTRVFSLQVLAHP